MQTALGGLLGIQVPVIQAAMNWATDGTLVAAVSNAAGLGMVGPNAGAIHPDPDPAVDGERLREQIRQVRRLTDDSPRPRARAQRRIRGGGH